MNFDPVTLDLVTEVTTGETLKFKSGQTGALYEAKPEHTLLAGQGVRDLDSVTKYKDTLRVTAYDPTNARAEYPEGCPRCKRKVISFQRLGPEKRVVYVCLCGQQWGPKGVV